VDGAQRRGGPVEPPAERPTLYATVTSTETLPRREIVPGWARNPNQRREVARWVGNETAYRAAYHTTRLPKYALKVLLWSPVGLLRGVYRIARWTLDGEGAGIRQHMATHNQAREYLLLSR